jgi:release factor glutamine methyltransferase
MVAAMLPTLMSLLQRSADYLKSHGIDNARREAEWLFSDALALTRLDLYTRFDMPVEEADVVRLRTLVQRRGRREPLAYVLGNQDFCGLRLTVGPGVLVPRPETEELVGLVLAESHGAGPLLDVGTGSGAIALALKQARPGNEVDASDASEQALAIAAANGQRLGLSVRWIRCHLASTLPGGYAAVVANLPYIAETERGQCDPELAFEPQEALYSGPDGLNLIRELIADARRLLLPQGILWLEHGWQQGPAITEACRVRGLSCAIRADLAGKPRFARITVSPN